MALRLQRYCMPESEEHVCEECGRTFPDEEELVAHLREAGLVG